MRAKWFDAKKCKPGKLEWQLFVWVPKCFFFRSVRFLNFLPDLEDLGHLHPNSSSGQLPPRIPHHTFCP